MYFLIIIIFFIFAIGLFSDSGDKPLGEHLEEKYPKFWARTFKKNYMYSFPEHSPSDIMSDKEFKKWVTRWGYMLNINK